MATTAYEKIPVPGFTSPTATYTDTEIAYSAIGLTQKGVTLAGGQGVLPAGTLLAQKTSDKLYYAYNNAGTGGIDTARGVLRKDADTTSGPQQANIVIQGILKLSTLHGVDAAALTDLGATTDTVRGTFKF